MTSETVPNRKASPHTADNRRLSSWNRNALPHPLGCLLSCVGLGEGLADEDGSEDDEGERPVGDRLCVPPPGGDVTGVKAARSTSRPPK